MKWFWDEYRRHPAWLVMLLMLLAAGLILDATLIPGAASYIPSSWRAGSLKRHRRDRARHA